jgi:hypothetical protein
LKMHKTRAFYCVNRPKLRLSSGLHGCPTSGLAVRQHAEDAG